MRQANIFGHIIPAPCHAQWCTNIQAIFPSSFVVRAQPHIDDYDDSERWYNEGQAYFFEHPITAFPLLKCTIVNLFHSDGIYLHNIQIKIGHCSSYICEAYWKKAWAVVAHLVAAAAVWLRVLGALIRKSNSTLATKKTQWSKNCTLKSEKKWSHTEITFSIWS